MVLAGVSLWLLRKKDNQSFALARRLTAKTAAAIAVLVGLLTLAEHLFGVDFGIDRLFLVTAPNARAVMSPLAAGGFVLLALALLGPDWRTRRRTGVAQFLCFGAMMGAFLGFLGLGSRSKRVSHYPSAADVCNLLCHGKWPAVFAPGLGHGRAPH
jgi:hypothetical protein